MSVLLSNHPHTPAVVPFQKAFAWQELRSPGPIATLSHLCSQHDGYRNLDDGLTQSLLQGSEQHWGWLERDGRAYVQAARRATLGQLEVLVHPEWRGLGWGQWLLDTASAWLRDRGCREVDIWAYGDVARTVDWLQRQDFQSQKVLASLARGRGKVALPDWADGWSLARFRPQDAAPWHELHSRVQRDKRQTWSLQRLYQQLQDPLTPAQNFWLLWQRKRLRGYIWLKQDEIFLWAVDPDCRGQGLGNRLLAWACSQGGRRAFCDASNLAAMGSLQRLSFSVVSRDRCLRRTF